MRYLIVCDYSLTFLGGAQTALMRQAEALAAQGNQVAVLAPDITKVNLSKSIQLIEPPAGKIMPGTELPMFRKTPSLQAFAKKVIGEFKPDAVLSHSEFALVTSVTEAARNQGIPSLHTVHTFFWQAPAFATPLAPIARAIYQNATKLPWPKQKLAKRPMDSALRNMTLATCHHASVTVSPSKHQGEKIKAAGVKHVEVVSNVTETKGKPSPLPKSNQLKLAWIGRFSPEKRLEVALEALAIANRQLETPIELHIAGGPARSGENQVWLGKLTSDQVSQLLTNSHALVMTSLGFDNQPMVILEAFAHGRPVILTDPVLGKEFGDAAILSETPDAKGLAATLVKLAKNIASLDANAKAATEAAKLSTAKVHAERVKELTERFAALG